MCTLTSGMEEEAKRVGSQPKQVYCWGDALGRRPCCDGVAPGQKHSSLHVHKWLHRLRCSRSPLPLSWRGCGTLKMAQVVACCHGFPGVKAKHVGLLEQGVWGRPRSVLLHLLSHDVG